MGLVIGSRPVCSFQIKTNIDDKEPTAGQSKGKNLEAMNLNKVNNCRHLTVINEEAVRSRSQEGKPLFQKTLHQAQPYNLKKTETECGGQSSRMTCPSKVGEISQRPSRSHYPLTDSDVYILF